MIVINVIILALCLWEFCDGADVQEGRLNQFLRRRTGSQVKRAQESTSIVASKGFDEKASSHEGTSKKFIGFGLRQSHKSEEKPVSSFGSTVFGFFNTAVTGISKTLEAIDNLEKAYEAEESKSINTPQPPFIISNDPKRAKIISQLIAGAFSNFDEEENDSGVDSGSSGDVPDKCDNLAASGITVFDEDEEDDDIIEESTHAEMVSNSVNLNQETVDSSPDTVIVNSNVQAADSQQTSSPEMSNSNLISLNYNVLSDSDSESWEKIELNMIENVNVLVKKPEVAKFVYYFGNDQKSLISFLATVFVKLAKKIFFKPSSTNLKLKKSASFEDFITEFDEILLRTTEEGAGHRFLDFETAHRILFHDDAKDDTKDWDWCLLLPNQQDFDDALEYVSSMNSDDLKTIETDLPRLAQRFYEFYAEKNGRVPLETDSAELREKIRKILVFIMAFESKPIPSSIESPYEAPPITTLPFVFDSFVQSTSSSSLSTFQNQPIIYLQGFDSVVAYFAINFDLECAGPLAYRFFQLYLSEIINVGYQNLREAVRKIDARAVNLVRAYLKDQVGGAFVLNFEILLGILELYPFSDRTASLLYVTAATTWTDLDRLMQFLLVKVPQSQAHKSISLLAAANMLFSMLALEKLFKEELLGSEEWAGLKEQLSHAKNRDQLRNSLDSVVLNFMGEMYLMLNDKIVHAGKEFDEYLLVTESLLPYLQEFN